MFCSLQLPLKQLFNRALLSTQDLLTTDLFSSSRQADREEPSLAKGLAGAARERKKMRRGRLEEDVIIYKLILSCSCSRLVLWQRIGSVLIVLSLSLVLLAQIKWPPIQVSQRCVCMCVCLWGAGGSSSALGGIARRGNLKWENKPAISRNGRRNLCFSSGCLENSRRRDT